MESEIHKCPVCYGNGLVPNGFYSSTTGQWESSSTNPEPCRSCKGKGYIVINLPQEGRKGDV